MLIYNCKKSHLGATLIEVVCTIGILGILAGPMLTCSLNLFRLWDKAMVRLELQTEAINLANFIKSDMKDVESIENISKKDFGRYTLKGYRYVYDYQLINRKLFVTEGKRTKEPEILYSNSIDEFDFIKIDSEVKWVAKFEKEGIMYEVERWFYFN